MTAFAGACDPALAARVHECDGLIWYYDTRKTRTPRTLPGRTRHDASYGYVETTGERCGCRCHAEEHE